MRRLKLDLQRTWNTRHRQKFRKLLEKFSCTPIEFTIEFLRSKLHIKLRWGGGGKMRRLNLDLQRTWNTRHRQKIRKILEKFSCTPIELTIEILRSKLHTIVSIYLVNNIFLSLRSQKEF